MKRFTETNKWRDPWFRRLSSPAKQLWEYLRDNCDQIGLIEIDFALVSSDCGQQIDESHIAEIGDRAQQIGPGKFFLPKFIHFQYGELTASCPPHRPIIALIEAHKLVRVGLHYAYPTCIEDHYPNARVALPLRQDKTRQEKEKDKKEGVQGERKYHKDSRTALHLLNEGSGRHFRENDTNLTFISSRLSEPEVDIDGVRQMIARQCRRWKGTPQEEYLRPETLFNKTKFDSYYASRNEPIIVQTNGASGSKSFDRNKGTLNEGHAKDYDLGKIQAARAIRDAQQSKLGEDA